MFLRIPTKKSMKNYSDEIIHLKEKLDKADAVVIGAGAGLSTAAGFTYAGERFEKHFSDFKQKYTARTRKRGIITTAKTR